MKRHELEPGRGGVTGGEAGLNAATVGGRRRRRAGLPHTHHHGRGDHLPSRPESCVSSNLPFVCLWDRSQGRGVRQHICGHSRMSVDGWRLEARRRYRAAVDDRTLIAAMVRGDPRGLDGAYQRYADRLYAYCRGSAARSRRGTDADVVHDTFLIASRPPRTCADRTGRSRGWTPSPDVNVYAHSGHAGAVLRWRQPRSPWPNRSTLAGRCTTSSCASLFRRRRAD